MVFMTVLHNLIKSAIMKLGYGVYDSFAQNERDS
jgi:hypothetical protein